MATEQNGFNEPPNETLKDLLGGVRSCVKIPDDVLFGFIIAIVIVGLFGNVVVFIGILVLKEFKKSMSNWYMLHLTVAHILFLLMLPFTAFEDKVGSWTFSLGLCKAKEGIIMVNYYASVFFLEMLSLDLYIAVTKSQWENTFRTLKIASIISAATWIVSICLPVPLYIFSHVDGCNQCSYNFPMSSAETCAQANTSVKGCNELFNQTLTPDEINAIWKDFTNYSSVTDIPSRALEETCRINPVPRSYRIWLFTNFCVMLVLPLVLLCVCYGIIIRTMVKSRAGENDTEKRNRRRITFMMVAFIALFVAAWVPWFVVKIALTTDVIALTRNGCRKLNNFMRIMVYLYCALMPYIYAFMAPRFYRRFISARAIHSPESHVSPATKNAAAEHQNENMVLEEVKLDDGEDKE